MDEQGIYCPQCRAYVHFWLIPEGGHGPRGADDKKPAPGTEIEMPKACRQCGYKSTYKTSDIRTRRVPTEPVRAAMLGPEGRRASTIPATPSPDDEKD
jgi:hypothetical protein